MDLAMFGNDKTGTLVPIADTDPVRGPWQHHAFLPDPLTDTPPELAPTTYLSVADARAALAALDSTSARLPNPTMFRMPALRREAQATSALEGTYAPLDDVLAADVQAPGSAEIREIVNYLLMADHAFAWVADGRPLSVGMLEDLQALLVSGTPAAERCAGEVRPLQVAVGRRRGALPDELPVTAARFVPPPPGDELVANLRQLVDWIRRDHRRAIDPVVASAMGHYQFESLHPFYDGSGRIGRLLVVLQLHSSGVLDEPTLTISPWFEARRSEYYDRLLAVSTDGDWDGYIAFFARGIEASAASTRRQMLALIDVQKELKEVVRRSSLRAESALQLVDYAISHTIFSVKSAADALGVSIGRANALVSQLTSLGVLSAAGAESYDRRFFAPRAHAVLLGGD